MPRQFESLAECKGAVMATYWFLSDYQPGTEREQEAMHTAEALCEALHAALCDQPEKCANAAGDALQRAQDYQSLAEAEMV